MRKFVSAFDHGRIETLDALFAKGPAFRWYSARGPDARLGSESKDRATLRAYFIRRHARGEHLTIIRLREGTHGNVSVDFRRRARDLRPQVAASKAAVDCSAVPARIVVLSVGGPG